MNFGDLGQLVAALGGLAGVGAVIDALRRRRKLGIDQGTAVATTAVKLVERLEKRAVTLESQLDSTTEKLTQTRQRAADLDAQLHTANGRADDLAEQLADAQIELRHLRLQVKSLSQELDRREVDRHGIEGP